MNEENKIEKLSDLDFNKFKELANDESLSRYEKIGFFNHFREGKEALIWEDIQSKVSSLEKDGARILDIGPGCSDLPFLLLKNAEVKKQNVVLIDSQEMLNQLPDFPFCEKFSAMFPSETKQWSMENQNSFDAIICYSVLHYIAAESSVELFIGAICDLLAPDGFALIGDVPNVSKRNRFFSSEEGIRFHQNNHGTNSFPQINWNEKKPGEFNDDDVFALLKMARVKGLEAFVLPQKNELPMANRREDILFVKHK
jgi:2-polyprenyl-3-methyl-5-hydroxy-6-metoxy-1,4-benzoquinol methylase